MVKITCDDFFVLFHTGRYSQGLRDWFTENKREPGIPHGYICMNLYDIKLFRHMYHKFYLVGGKFTIGQREIIRKIIWKYRKQIAKNGFPEEELKQVIQINPTWDNELYVPNEKINIISYDASTDCFHMRCAYDKQLVKIIRGIRGTVLFPMSFTWD